MPADCRSLLRPAAPGAILNWQSTVMLEHCDRIKRLKRISVRLPANEQPQFFQSLIPKDRLPTEYGVDIPVLRVVFPDRVFFDTARSTLRPEALEIAAIIAESLRREPPDVTMFVAGHADRRGDADANEDLSINRADALASAVFRAGVNFSSIWRIGFGEDMPLVAGDDEYAWGANRRVEFLFAAKPEPIGSWLVDQQLTGLCVSRSAIDSDKCRSTLTVRPGYEAERYVASDKPRIRRTVARPPRQTLTPRPASKAAIRPGTGRKGAVAPSEQAQVVAAPTETARVVIIPKNAPRLIINPVNRKATPERISS